jgi:hypothetical protein
MVAGGNHGLPWRRAGRQWLCLPVAIKRGDNNDNGPEAFFSEINCWQSHVIADYGNVAAWNTMCFMP